MRSVGLTYLAALGLLFFLLVAALQFLLIGHSVQRQVTLVDAVYAQDRSHTRVSSQAMAQVIQQRAQTTSLVRVGIFSSLAFVPIIVLWLASFTFTVKRARADRTQALRDALTGAGNRRSALSMLRSLARRRPDAFGVIYIDLDGFKKINDVNGHAAGDAILKEVTQRLTSELRPADMVCRLGGDEFVCVIAPPTTANAIYAIAERLRRRVAHTYNLENDLFVIDCSVGVSVFPQDGWDEHTLLDRADRAMYSAKASGGGVCAADALIERRLTV